MKALRMVIGALVASCAAEPAAIVAEHVTTSYDDAPLPARQSRASMLVEAPRPVQAARVVRSECEVGALRSCMPMSAEPGDDGVPRRRMGPFEHCVLGTDGVGHFTHATCNTPLAISFDGAPVSFTQVGADFHIGTADRTEWISARTPWLALDRDGNGCIDSATELFAGFAPLAALDANGDGVLDARDPAFGELVTWSDRNQDKRCTPDEVRPLTLAKIPLAATAVAPKLGSFEGEFVTVDGARIVDVYLADDRSR